MAHLTEGEAVLIQRVLAGEESAVVELIQQYQNLVRRIIFRIVDDPMEREELCQDSFLKVLSSLSFFRGDAKLTTWIGRIAYREALQHLRRKRIPLVQAEEREAAIDELPSPEPSALGEMERKELQEFVFRSVELLSPAQKMTVTMYYLEELDVAEIAEIMGIPENTVKSHLLRSRQKLRDLVAEEAKDRGYTG